MLSRFKQNVRRFPRTAVVVFGLYIVFAVVTSLFAGTTGSRHAVIGAVVIVALFDGLTYIWFMGNARRVAALIDILDTFEGREPVEYPVEFSDDSDEEDQDCGDPECASCHPEYNEIVEECAVCGSKPCHCPPSNLVNDDRGQDVAEYAVMLAVMLIIVIGTVRLISSSAGNTFSQIGSQIGSQ